MRNILILIAVLAAALAGPPPAQAEKVLRVGITGFPSVRGNPFKTTSGLPILYTYAAIFEGLTRVDNSAEAVPMLAESWESESETSWLFHLRPDAVFSNGEPVDADAVVYTFSILQEGEGPTYPIAVELANIDTITAVDDLTVRVTTHTPNILLPNEIAALKIMPPRYWSEVGPDIFAGAPVGTGPFLIEEFASTRMRLMRSPTAWRQPKVDVLELNAVPEAAARVQGVLSGRLDIGVQLGPDDRLAIEAAGHGLVVSPDPGAQVLAFITVKDSPLQDIRVRRALNYAVNREAIIEGLLGGEVPVATQPAPRIAFGYDPDIEPWPYDPEKAKALLAEAGYPDGFSMVAEILFGTAAYLPQVYQQAAADLARIGVEVELRAIPIPQYARGLYQGDWAGTAFGVDYGVNPSLDALRPLVRHSCLWTHPWYCDPTILPKIEEAAAAFDLDRRRELTQGVMRHQLEQAPGIFLYDLTRFDAVRQGVNNFSIEVGHINYDEIEVPE